VNTALGKLRDKRGPRVLRGSKDVARALSWHWSAEPTHGAEMVGELGIFFLDLVAVSCRARARGGSRDLELRARGFGV